MLAVRYRRPLVAAVLVLCALAHGAWAKEAEPLADDQALETRVNNVAAELRCLVCQNQTIADSHADLAVQLKDQIRDKLRAGQSEDQIKDYMVQRYGEFVLYRPKIEATTLALWFGPFLLMAGGIAVLVMTLKKRARDEAAASGGGTAGPTST